MHGAVWKTAYQAKGRKITKCLVDLRNCAKSSATKAKQSKQKVDVEKREIIGT